VVVLPIYRIDCEVRIVVRSEWHMQYALQLSSYGPKRPIMLKSFSEFPLNIAVQNTMTALMRNGQMM